MAGWVGTAGALDGAALAGPFAEPNRLDLSRRLATYLSLVELGDPRRFEYRVAGTRADALDAALRGRSVSVRAVALDDPQGLLAAELVLAPGEGLPEEPRLVFLRLAGGYIAQTILVEDGAQFLPGDGLRLPAPPPADDQPLPESVRLSRMTPERFRDYLDMFGRFDERFVEYYTPDVLFTAAPAPAPLQGREAVLKLYRPLRAELGESLTVHHLAIDNEAGLMMAALSNRLTAFGNVKLPSRQLRAGDQFVVSGGIIYGLQGGRISLIRDVGG
jgi:hypothetical protein